MGGVLEIYSGKKKMQRKKSITYIYIINDRKIYS